MKAMKFPEPGRAEIVDIPMPVPKEGEVLVRVKAADICASDVAAFTRKHPFRRPPVITGHEFSGEIIQVGPNVRTRKIGERVAVEPQLGCGICTICHQGTLMSARANGSSGLTTGPGLSRSMWWPLIAFVT